MIVRRQQILALIVVIVCTITVWAKTDSFYDSVNDILQDINYYSVLGVRSDASNDEIKKAFRRLALELYESVNVIFHHCYFFLSTTYM